MKFRINGIHVAYVDDDLLKEFRESLEIDPNVSDYNVIRNVAYKKILYSDFIPSRIEEDIQMMKDVAKYHKFDNVGDYISFIMHTEIEKKLKTCLKCPNLKANSYCPTEDINVYPNFCYCNMRVNMISDEEMIEILEALNDSIPS